MWTAIQRWKCVCCISNT